MARLRHRHIPPASYNHYLLLACVYLTCPRAQLPIANHNNPRDSNKAATRNLYSRRLIFTVGVKNPKYTADRYTTISVVKLYVPFKPSDTHSDSSRASDYITWRRRTSKLPPHDFNISELSPFEILS